MKMGAFALGYHGCDRSVAENLLGGNEVFSHSKNATDWLGHGIYFWENNPERAIEWAKFLNRISDKRTSSNKPIKRPYAVGAIIDMGNCLDLTEGLSLKVLKAGYDSLAETLETIGLNLPENRKATDSDEDLLKRNLDCMVINHVHELRKIQNLEPFDTVRGAFPEGGELYPGAAIREKTHIQICVRDTNRIKGIFRIPEIG